jgi:hypothetical protein
VFDGVGVLVAFRGGNGPWSTKEIKFLKDGATVYVPSSTQIFLVWLTNNST